MRKLAFMSVFVLAVAMGCKDDDEDTTTTPTPLPDLKVTTTLSGANEVPANGSLVTGSVDGKLNQETKILNLSVMYSDTADSTYADSAFVPTGWKIYKGGADTTGAAVIDLGTSFATPFTFTDTLTADQVTDLKAGNYYINIHSKKYPEGEIRGQLKAEE